MSTLTSNIKIISGVMTQKYPLQTKLVRYIVLAMTCCGLFFGLLSLSLQYIYLLNDIKHKTHELAVSQLPSLRMNLFSYNDINVTLLLESLNNQQIIRSAQILDYDENLIDQKYIYSINYEGLFGDEKLGGSVLSTFIT